MRSVVPAFHPGWSQLTIVCSHSSVVPSITDSDLTTWYVFFYIWWFYCPNAIPNSNITVTCPCSTTALTNFTTPSQFNIADPYRSLQYISKHISIQHNDVFICFTLKSWHIPEVNICKSLYPQLSRQCSSSPVFEACTSIDIFIRVFLRSSLATTFILFVTRYFLVSTCPYSLVALQSSPSILSFLRVPRCVSRISRLYLLLVLFPVAIPAIVHSCCLHLIFLSSTQFLRIFCSLISECFSVVIFSLCLLLLVSWSSSFSGLHFFAVLPLPSYIPVCLCFHLLSIFFSFTLSHWLFFAVSFRSTGWVFLVTVFSILYFLHVSPTWFLCHMFRLHPLSICSWPRLSHHQFLEDISTLYFIDIYSLRSSMAIFSFLSSLYHRFLNMCSSHFWQTLFCPYFRYVFVCRFCLTLFYGFVLFFVSFSVFLSTIFIVLFNHRHFVGDSSPRFSSLYLDHSRLITFFWTRFCSLFFSVFPSPSFPSNFVPISMSVTNILSETFCNCIFPSLPRGSTSHSLIGAFNFVFLLMDAYESHYI